MAALLYGSAQPDVPMPPGLSDKPTHLLGYIPLAVLLVRALAGGLRAPITVAVALAAMALATLYGGALELLQMFVPGRYGDANDLLADASGAALGAFACWLCGIIRNSQRQGANSNVEP
jgi:VanZ family protein